MFKLNKIGFNESLLQHLMICSSNIRISFKYISSATRCKVYLLVVRNEAGVDWTQPCVLFIPECIPFLMTRLEILPTASVLQTSAVNQMLHSLRNLFQKPSARCLSNGTLVTFGFKLSSVFVIFQSNEIIGRVWPSRSVIQYSWHRAYRNPWQLSFNLFCYSFSRDRLD